MRERDRDAAAAGADVRRAHRAVALARDRDRSLHQDLGVGVGHEHRRRDDEVEGHELLVPDQVRDRLAAGATRHEPAVSSELLLRHEAVEPYVEVDATDTERVREQNLCVQAR